jgi:hypothetical protein
VFEAGSVIGHFKLDTADYEAGGKRIGASNESMTGSVFKAQLAYDLFKQGLQKVIAFVKDAVTEYNSHALAVKQTEAVLKSTAGAAGMTAKEVIGLSDRMMDLTGIEHDNVLAAENLLLTFTKVGKDIFPQTTEVIADMSVALKEDLKSAAIQVGKALQDPILGVTALRRVGVNFNEAQTEVIKNLVNTGKAAEAQAMILRELQTEFGGSARAARDTFAGALKNLDNQIGEVKEGIGAYIAAVGRPLVEHLGDAARKVAEFVTSAEGAAKIEAFFKPVGVALAVVWDVAKRLWEMMKALAGQVAADLKQALADVGGEGDAAVTVFNLLGGAVKMIATGFVVMAKVVEFAIDAIINLVAMARSSVDVLKALGDALIHPFDPAKWKAVGTAAETWWATWKKTVGTALADVIDIVATAIKELSTFSTDSQKYAAEIKAVADAAAAGIDRTFRQMGASVEGAGFVVQDTLGDVGAANANFMQYCDAMILEFTKRTEEAAKATVAGEEEIVAGTEASSKDTLSAIGAIAESLAAIITGSTDDAAVNILKLFQTVGDTMAAMPDPTVKMVGEIISAVAGIVVTVIETIQSIVDKAAEIEKEINQLTVDLYDQQIANAEAARDAMLARIDAELNAELHRRGLVEKENEKAYRAEIDRIDKEEARELKRIGLVKTEYDKAYKDRIAAIDAEEQAALRAAGVMELTAVEDAQATVARLQAELALATDVEDQKRIAADLAEAQKALTRATIEADYQAKRDAAEAEHQAKEDARADLMLKYEEQRIAAENLRAQQEAARQALEEYYQAKRDEAENQANRKIALIEHDKAEMEKKIKIVEVNLAWQKAVADLGLFNQGQKPAIDALYTELLAAVNAIVIPPAPPSINMAGGGVATGETLARIGEVPFHPEVVAPLEDLPRIAAQYARAVPSTESGVFGGVQQNIKADIHYPIDLDRMVVKMGQRLRGALR